MSELPKSARDIVAVLHTGGNPNAYLPTVLSLRRAHPEITILGDRGLEEAGVIPVAGSLVAKANIAYEERKCHVLLISGPAAFPSDALSPALTVVEDDIRMATVSFFASAAAFLSFPYRNHQAAHQIESLDEEMITRRLRTQGPEVLPTPIPFATGPAVLLSAFALSAVGPLSDLGDPGLVLVDFSLRARQRGFFDVLDASTFLTRLYDVGVPMTDVLRALDDQIDSRGQVLLTEARELKKESDAKSSPLSVAHGVARSKVLGLRLLIDGSCLGPKEMGTQVQAVAMISALAQRPDVDRVSVALWGPAPPYAQSLLADSKVDARPAPGGDLSGFPEADVAHQPFQPDGPIEMGALRAASARSVTTLLDLIAYHGRSYHGSAESWMGCRARIARSVAEADAVIVPSEDIARQVRLERLSIDEGRLFLVPLGSDHLGQDDAERMPAELVARGFTAGEFLLVLGAGYSHKNRDTAIKVFRELSRRGLPHELVMVGASVLGSSRVLEAAAWGGVEGMFVIPDTSSEERNWLLRHASLVLYLSSAEGFGLVPFEAARLGTPTVLVPAGPLRHIAEGLPVVPQDWNLASLADAAEALLSDPATAEAQVRATLSAGTNHTWEAVAAMLVDVYRTVLGRPSLAARGGSDD